MRSKRLILFITVFVMAVSVFAITTSDVEAASPTYWLKVNKQANVVNVYQKSGGKWIPVRAMLCSCGTKYNGTPSGTFKLGTKYRWRYMFGGTYGQYCTRFKGHCLFHSVTFDKKNNYKSLLGREYNKLGRPASHGCIRLSVMDAKWVYEQCKKGTKVTTYKSKNPGPLGKPVGFKVKGTRCWDPTDPYKYNKDFRMRGPVISISKSKARTVQYGESYSLTKGVTAKNKYALQKLSVSVYKIEKWDADAEGYIKCDKLDTQELGQYRITYRAYSKYCGRSAKYTTFVVSVIDKSKPTIDAQGTRTVEVGSTDAVAETTAKQDSVNLTENMLVTITNPGGQVSGPMSYTAAKNFVFENAGAYEIKYEVTNYYYPEIKTERNTRVISGY